MTGLEGRVRPGGVRKTLRPGQKGTHKFVRDWGPRLVCVRYRFDEEEKTRYTTVEIVTEGPQPWSPPRRPHPDALVWLRVRPDEWKVIRGLRAERAWWDDAKKLWRARYESVDRLRLRRRILKNRPVEPPSRPPAPTSNHPQVVISRNQAQNGPRNS